MKVSQNKVVIIHYAVSDKEGMKIDSSFGKEPLPIIQGNGFVIPGLDKALVDREAGDAFDVDIKAEDAYGPRHEQLVQSVPKDMLSNIDDLHVGMHLNAGTNQGTQSVLVIAIDDETVTVDGNHPLAGRDLSFQIEILEVRDATAEELEHGHVHGEGGCSH